MSPYIVSAETKPSVVETPSDAVQTLSRASVNNHFMHVFS